MRGHYCFPLMSMWRGTSAVVRSSSLIADGGRMLGCAAHHAQLPFNVHQKTVVKRILHTHVNPSKGYSREKRSCLMIPSLQFSSSSNYRASEEDVMEGLNEVQVKLMEEECILVDKEDNKIGSASKKTCHLLANINKGMLHRAFSVFLFDSQGRLLLQQRADEKITFPNHFTNTCCSHPLNFPLELDETDAIGVKRAAQRKLKHELGIEPDQVPLEDFNYLTRILYKAENVPKDGRWGEHEIDYILFIQKDVDIAVNPNEVKSHKYVSVEELRDIIANADKSGIILTPWFKLICQSFLFKWWSHLKDISSQTDRETIHNML